MHFDSFTFGQIKRVTRTNNSTYILEGDGDSNYRCELVEGDKVLAIKHDGFAIMNIVLNIDPDNNKITLDDVGEVDAYSLIFIGRLD